MRKFYQIQILLYKCASFIMQNSIVSIPIYKFHHMSSNLQILLHINSIVRILLCKFHFVNSVMKIHCANFIVHLSILVLFVRLESNLKYFIALLVVC